MTTLAPRDDVLPGRAARMSAPLVTVGGLAASTAALHFRDPHVDGSWGFCPTSLMGFYCPGCGGLRAVNDVTNGDLVAAASSNLAFVVIAPFVVVALLVWLSDSWRGVRRRIPWERIPRSAYAVPLAAIIAFTILRNLAIGSWLAP